jgi:hypothetical protein
VCSVPVGALVKKWTRRARVLMRRMRKMLGVPEDAGFGVGIAGVVSAGVAEGASRIGAVSPKRATAAAAAFNAAVLIGVGIACGVTLGCWLKPGILGKEGMLGRLKDANWWGVRLSMAVIWASWTRERMMKRMLDVLCIY